MTDFARSARDVEARLKAGNLSGDAAVRDLLAATTARRTMDLSDLAPMEQARMFRERAQELQPSKEALAQRIEHCARTGRRFIAKFGIDPTGAEVHLGHAVPMMQLSRFQRMGHRVIFIVGDVTAKIGDPSGRSDERPPLTDEDIAANLSTYRQQVSPFFDFSKSEFRHNGDWLREVRLPRLIEITSRIPLSMPLQREDFRKRIEEKSGLTVAELLYSVAMALDSVELNCDIELGGIDQFLNMQMCRKAMEICGQEPEIVLATPLIEGTDGSGAKMSKSRGNYVPLTADADEIFGKLMSVPDRLLEPYLKALTEWRDAEIAIAAGALADGSLHPMDLKKILAGDVTAAIHGVDAAMAARETFNQRFSRRDFSGLEDLPQVSDTGLSLVDAVKQVGFAKSNGEVLRLLQQNGIRLVVDDASSQQQFVFAESEARQDLSQLVHDKLGAQQGRVFLKVGRRLAVIGG